MFTDMEVDGMGELEAVLPAARVGGEGRAAPPPLQTSTTAPPLAWWHAQVAQHPTPHHAAGVPGTAPTCATPLPMQLPLPPRAWAYGMPLPMQPLLTDTGAPEQQQPPPGQSVEHFPVFYRY
jgi:hypothetical protein